MSCEYWCSQKCCWRSSQAFWHVMLCYWVSSSQWYRITYQSTWIYISAISIVHWEMHIHVCFLFKARICLEFLLIIENVLFHCTKSFVFGGSVSWGQPNKLFAVVVLFPVYQVFFINLLRCNHYCIIELCYIGEEL